MFASLCFRCTAADRFYQFFRYKDISYPNTTTVYVLFSRRVIHQMEEIVKTHVWPIVINIFNCIHLSCFVITFSEFVLTYFYQRFYLKKRGKNFSTLLPAIKIFAFHQDVSFLSVESRFFRLLRYLVSTGISFGKNCYIALFNNYNSFLY
jgi:hypothetical protein